MLNSAVHGGNLQSIFADFAQYQYVILGDGLEKNTHGDHANTVALLNSPLTTATTFFGYIDASTTIQNLPLSEIEIRVNEWAAMGINGIFYDDFEYDYGVSRQRMNTIIGYAKAKNLPVFVNGNRPEEIFGAIVHPVYNPAGLPTVLTSTDFYLNESYLITEGNFQDAVFWKQKADLLRNYQQSIGFKIMSVTTNASSNEFSQTKFFYNWYGALLYNHEATGWGDYWFSSSTGVAPLRAVPTISPGSSFFNQPTVEGSEVVRFTNNGKIWLNPTAHSFGFIQAATCRSLSSGTWHDAGRWSCGRIPLSCDDVQIASGTTVTLSSADGQARTLRQEGTLTIQNRQMILSPR
ncbi:hypothetical protein EZE20_03590 [Arundinibacter roseus]|uniref:Uncharacterized protein n=1 Tax=Arundinibacter roseus TaxID=2070510 RepID=A0A4R4KIP0_9BACT|nr:hypothetical protein EZE20_03590 [Arundinibacter roseus]